MMKKEDEEKAHMKKEKVSSMAEKGPKEKAKAKGAVATTMALC